MDSDALRKLRKRMGLTQAQMAELIRVPVATVKKLDAGTLADEARRDRTGRLADGKRGFGTPDGPDQGRIESHRQVEGLRGPWRIR